MIGAARKQLIMTIAIGVLAIAIVLIYIIFDPSTTPFPRCPFLMATGWECPGCGSQRAIHALLHGNIHQAWQQNALLVLSIPVIIVMVTAQLLRNKYPSFYNAVNSRWVIWSILVIIVGWWIGRNL